MLWDFTICKSRGTLARSQGTGGLAKRKDVLKIRKLRSCQSTWSELHIPDALDLSNLLVVAYVSISLSSCYKDATKIVRIQSASRDTEGITSPLKVIRVTIIGLEYLSLYIALHLDRQYDQLIIGWDRCRVIKSGHHSTKDASTRNGQTSTIHSHLHLHANYFVEGIELGKVDELWHLGQANLLGIRTIGVLPHPAIDVTVTRAISLQRSHRLAEHIATVVILGCIGPANGSHPHLLRNVGPASSSTDHAASHWHFKKIIIIF